MKDGVIIRWYGDGLYFLNEFFVVDVVINILVNKMFYSVLLIVSINVFVLVMMFVELL